MARLASRKAADAACPICGSRTLAAFRPFCSRRCAEIDLGQWLGGGYAIAGSDPAEAEDAAPPPAPEAPQDDD